MRLVLVSHAQTQWNAQGRFQGHADAMLNERGRRQALLVQRHLAQESIQAIVASDLRRACKTAEILALPHRLSVRTDPRLRELCFGDWEGLTYAEIEQRYPAALAAWQEGSLRLSPPNGESLADLARRLQSFLCDLWGHPKEATILLVAHRGSLRMLLCLLLGLPVERHWEFCLEIASLSEVEVVSGNARIVCLNQTMGDL